jgi:hypothetical protein
MRAFPYVVMRDDSLFSASVIRSGISVPREEPRPSVPASLAQILRLVEELAQIGLWSIDLRSGVLSLSDGAGRLTGVSPGWRPCAPGSIPRTA